MPSTSQDFTEAIKAYVAEIEAGGNEEALLAAAKCLSSYRKDRKFYGEIFGIDQCPKLIAVIEALPEDFAEQNFYGQWWPSGYGTVTQIKCDQKLTDLLHCHQQSVQQYIYALTRRRDAYDMLEETFATLERDGSDADIRLAVSCIILLPWSHSLRHMNLWEGKPRLRAALKNGHGGAQHVCTEACRTPASAGVKATVNGQLHAWRDLENIQGRVATLIIHYQDEHPSHGY